MYIFFICFYHIGDVVEEAKNHLGSSGTMHPTATMDITNVNMIISESIICPCCWKQVKDDNMT